LRFYVDIIIIFINEYYVRVISKKNLVTKVVIQTENERFTARIELLTEEYCEEDVCSSDT